MSFISKQTQLENTQRLITHLGEKVNKPISICLWDGSKIPLAQDVDTDYSISIKDPGVVGSLLRRPSFENLLLHYVKGNVDVKGDLIDFAAVIREKRPKNKSIKLNKFYLLKQALPLIFTPLSKVSVQHEYRDDEVGRQESRRNNKEFIQFHYDVSNAFYALFLDSEMQYSCGYFTQPDNALDQAQQDKLEMICRKLRLKPGEKFLDIGCGWGGLICYAAKNYGVQAHGVTLSQTQYDFTKEKIKRLGLEDNVTVELRDYSTMDGSFDKIASIGMFEHIGLANMPRYFQKLNSLLHEGGVLLNHGISRHAKRNRRLRKKVRTERRLLLKYIFPGSELDNVGNTIDTMELNGFEVHDVEAWREHYALTTRHWYRRLRERKKEAVEYVGMEKYRMWLMYLAGVSIGFADGSMHICQVVASKRPRKGLSGMPLTRADLYK